MARGPGASPVGIRSVGYFAYSLSRTSASGLTAYVTSLRDELKHKGVHTRIAVYEADEGDPDVVWVPQMRGLRRISDALEHAYPERLMGLSTQIAIASAAVRLDRVDNVELIEFEEHAGMAVLAARLPLRCPVVVRLHGPNFLTAIGQSEREAAVVNELERKLVCAATAITSPSYDALHRVREHWGLSLEHAVVIPNPTPRLAEDQLWTGDTSGPILFVGRFDALKGFDLVVRAFEELARTDGARELWLVGPEHTLIEGGREWKSVSEYLAHVLPEPVRARVHYLGQRTRAEIREYRKQCACVVVASRFETFCLTAAEALMAGCPVVCSDAAALPELVQHEKTGLTFKSGDPHELARALTRLLSDGELARTLGREARASALARFSAEAVAEQMLAFYGETVQRARKNARGLLPKLAWG